MSMRKHLVTLCMRDNTEVTYKEDNGIINITFETAHNRGFKTLVVEGGTFRVVSNEGFNDSEVDYFVRFAKDNYALMEYYIGRDSNA